MIARFVRRPRVVLAVLCLSLAGVPVVASAQQSLIEFPGRPLYERFGLEAMGLFDLRGQFSSSTIIDVRPRLEYDILHIEGAHHLDLSSESFDAQVRALEEEHGSPLVFYCNGRQSYLGYRAAARASQLGVEVAQTYDGGLQDWAGRYPVLTRFQGELANEVEDHWIADEDLQARMLDPEEFARRTRQEEGVIVLDIRNASERDEISLFGGREIGAPLSDRNALDQILNRAQSNGYSLLFFDQHGQQVRWLQYYLEQRGIRDYHFLAGGIQGFYDELLTH